LLEIKLAPSDCLNYASTNDENDESKGRVKTPLKEMKMMIL
jgi:hypothetical protein